MKRLTVISVLSLVSALIISCTPVNNTVVVDPVKSTENNKKDIVVNNSIVTKPQVSTSTKPEIKSTPISVATPSATLTNNGIKDPKYNSTGVDKTIESLPSPSLTPTQIATPRSNNTFYPSQSPSPIPTSVSQNNTSTNNADTGVTPGDGYYVPTPGPTKFPYRVDWPVENVTKGFYNLTFKDEYRVRYYKEKKI